MWGYVYSMEPLKKTTSSSVSDGTGITSGMSEMVSGAFPDERKTRDARQKAFALEAAMSHGDTIDIPIDHYFCDGIYARTMYMPKGSVIVGKIHKYPQLNILAKGDVTVAMEDGPERLKAGWHKVCTPGAKRSFYAHEDSVWTVVLQTRLTDVEQIEKEFVAETEQEYLDFKNMLEDKT